MYLLNFWATSIAILIRVSISVSPFLVPAKTLPRCAGNIGLHLKCLRYSTQNIILTKSDNCPSLMDDIHIGVLLDHCKNSCPIRKLKTMKIKHEHCNDPTGFRVRRQLEFVFFYKYRVFTRQLFCILIVFFSL